MSSPVRRGSLGELFWQVADAVVLLRDGNVVAWNPAAARLFGVRPPDGSPVDAALEPVFGGAYEHVRRLLVTPGGAEIDASAECGLILDVTTWVLKETEVTVAIFRDVTPERRLVSGLARLSELGRELVGDERALPDVLQRIADEAKVLTGASYTAVILVRPGHPEEISHFVYNAPRELFPDRLPRLVGLLAVPVELRGTARIDDIRGHPAGVGIPVAHPPIGPLLAVPILGGDVIFGEIAVAGAPTERVFDGIDEQVITELAAHAATAVRWVQVRERTQADAALRREVVATARHDIRNPLTVAKGYVSLLAKRRDQMSSEQLDAAIVATRGALDRIDEFASKAFMDETDRLTDVMPDWQLIDLRSFVTELARDHNAASEVDGRVRLTVEEGLPDDFAGDPGMVRQVLDNLLSNAVKYGAPNTPVTLTARPEGAQVRFDVHNTGAGIPIEDQQRLFDPYWRAEAVRADGVPGTGLGLAIVRRLVDLHNGVLGVASRPDEGTTFWATFPQNPPDDVPVAGEKASS